VNVLIGHLVLLRIHYYTRVPGRLVRVEGRLAGRQPHPEIDMMVMVMRRLSVIAQGLRHHHIVVEVAGQRERGAVRVATESGPRDGDRRGRHRIALRRRTRTGRRTKRPGLLL